MIAAVHALTGAALGGLCQSRGQAAALGAISHLAADALPHRDLKVSEEAVLLGAALGMIGVTQGWGSREFAGAVGAVLPDVENVVARALDIPQSRLLLPTHRGYHGRRTSGFRGQLALALASLAVLLGPRSRCANKRERGNSS
ncbi:MAG: hypothetical protein JSV79_05230 [Armatimonadota bacterium]|nr:MAG: hypothetical protein JSV79_05230 [Armatimonadota bacterium]